MKQALIILSLAGVFILSGWSGMSMPAVDSIATNFQESIGGPSDWMKEIEAAFNPTWYEKFQSSDLVSKLQAMSGSAQK